MYFVFVVRLQTLNHCFSFFILVTRGVNVAPSGVLEIANLLSHPLPRQLSIQIPISNIFQTVFVHFCVWKTENMCEMWMIVKNLVIFISNCFGISIILRRNLRIFCGFYFQPWKLNILRKIKEKSPTDFLRIFFLPLSVGIYGFF